MLRLSSAPPRPDPHRPLDNRRREESREGCHARRSVRGDGLRCPAPEWCVRVFPTSTGVVERVVEVDGKAWEPDPAHVWRPEKLLWPAWTSTEPRDDPIS